MSTSVETGVGEPIACDVLITNGYVVTMNSSRTVYSKGSVAISDGVIVEVGPDRELAGHYRTARTIDAGGAAVHPGLFDCHAHVPLHTTRGAFPDSTDEEAYFGYYTRWQNSLDGEDEYASSLLACLEMLHNGITCFMEPGTAWEPDAVADAVGKIGIRASLAEPYLWDVDGFWYASQLGRAPSTRKRAMSLLGNQVWRNRDENALVRGHVGLYGIGSCTDELALAAKACADENHTFFTQHQSFELPDIKGDDDRLGRHALVHYHEIGVLGDNCTFSHMNAIRDDEVGPVVDSGMSIAWNPGNYMNWGVGDTYRTRVPELHRKGVTVAPGSDVAKVWAHGEQTLLGYLVVREKRDFLSAEELLEMSTLGGAKSMRMQDRLGSIEPGKRADVVIRTLDVPEAHPNLDPIRSLVLISRSKSVRTVIVDGRIVLEDGRPTLIEAGSVYEVARRSVERLTRKLGIRPGTVWPTVD